MKGGYRPGSGRKKGSIPWNKNVPMRDESKKKLSLSKKGQVPWNKDKKMPIVSWKMKGNKNGSGNKGRIFKSDTLKKMSLARLGKPSWNKGKKMSEESRVKNRHSHYERLKNLNPDYIPVKIRKERIIKNGGFHSKGEWETLKAQYNWTCPSCKEREPFVNQQYKYLTKDHIIAISMGGSDNIENIQPLCKSCNGKKQAKEITY